MCAVGGDFAAGLLTFPSTHNPLHKETKMNAEITFQAVSGDELCSVEGGEGALMPVIVSFIRGMMAGSGGVKITSADGNVNGSGVQIIVQNCAK
jgi:hypothetical protein